MNMPSDERSTRKVDDVIFSLVVICVAIGLLVGFAGLGVGLVFLSLPQAVGVGILSAGCGALYGLTFGARRLLRALVEVLKEMKS